MSLKLQSPGFFGLLVQFTLDETLQKLFVVFIVALLVAAKTNQLHHIGVKVPILDTVKDLPKTNEPTMPRVNVFWSNAPPIVLKLR